MTDYEINRLDEEHFQLTIYHIGSLEPDETQIHHSIKSVLNEIRLEEERAPEK